MIKSKFIKDILALLFDADNVIKEAKRQLDFISETEVEYTGVGVFINFDHADGIDKYIAKEQDLVLNGVTIKSPELKLGADSTLFFKNGLIDYLEIWSFDGEYPKHDLTNYKLKKEWIDSI